MLIENLMSDDIYLFKYPKKEQKEWISLKKTSNINIWNRKIDLKQNKIQIIDTKILIPGKFFKLLVKYWQGREEKEKQ